MSENAKIASVVALVFLVGLGLIAAFWYLDAQDAAENARNGRTGPAQARAWAAKFDADGPIDCVQDGWLYRCTVAKNGIPIALECWASGCAIQGVSR